MVKCPSCGLVQEDGEIFCPGCWREFADYTDPEESLPTGMQIRNVAWGISKHSRRISKDTFDRINVDLFGEPVSVDPPENALAPYRFDKNPKLNSAKGKLIDKKGRGWHLMVNEKNKTYHWRKIARKKGKKTGFSMAMRYQSVPLTLQCIAALRNSYEAALEIANYNNFSMEQALVDTQRNDAARKSQGAVMAKFFASLADGTAGNLPAPLNAISQEHAWYAVGKIDKSSLSASAYANAAGYEWLHLRGHGLGGAEEATNLVAGSHGANTEMAAIEIVLQQFSGKDIKYSVQATCENNTLLALFIEMVVFLDGKNIYSRKIDARRSTMYEIEYFTIQEELINRIVSGGLFGRTIAFVSGGMINAPQ